MLTRLVLPMLMLVLSALPAWAATFDQCEKTEIGIVSDSLKAAQKLAVRAAVVIGNTAEYDRWFGQYTDANAEVVRANFKSINRALQSDEVNVICPNDGEDGCKGDTFAYVYSDSPYSIYLCPAFFGMPVLESMLPNSDDYDTGTREGTIIHEISHFEVVAGTEDECYTRILCSDMARTRAHLVVNNADSYQYYSEDVALNPELAAN